VRTANRYLVRWRSSVAGEMAEAFSHERRARERLEELRERAYFESGVVVDTEMAGPTPEGFIRKHREFHDKVTA